MARVQFENGRIVEFEGNPTEQDINEVAIKLGIGKQESPKGLTDILSSSEPAPSTGDPIMDALVFAQKEVVGPIAQGANTAAFGIPRFLTSKIAGEDFAKQAFPEQSTALGKFGRFGAEAAGLIGGGVGRATAAIGRKLAPKGAGFGTRLASSAAQGAAGGALVPPANNDEFLNPKKRFKNAATGAGTGLIFTGAGEGLRKLPKLSARFSGIEPETFDEVSKKGFRKVLQTKYFDKKLPQKIQERIEQNIDDLQSAAENQYDELTTPLRGQPFDMPKLRGDVVKIANRVKKNPFETDVSRLDDAILDGIINKAKVRNLGDALDLRRNLDDVIYSNRGELRSSFGKKVRDLLNKELKKNKSLAKVDAEWTSLKSALRDGKRVLGETGEKFLARFSKLTDKQKNMLVNLERQIGGEPFIEDLTNWSLASQFQGKLNSFSVPGIFRSVSKPALRGALRTGEGVGNFLRPKLNEKAGLRNPKLLGILAASNLSNEIQ